MIDIQILFDRTLEELEKKTKANDEYELLMTTPLLRKLLIDGNNSLVSQINKKGKKLRFSVNVREPLHKRVPSVFTPEDLQTYFWFAKSGLDPEIADKFRNYNLQQLSFDDFLQQVVIYAKGQEITVRDLIKHLSDKEGGIHKQRKKLVQTEVKNIILQELGETIGINNLPAGLSTLRSINAIVIRNLSIFKS
jgi:hypothetical protein